ncbi:6-phosphogluconolactonase [Corynebacterium pollutisoli]|uniref:6-phosphogluconolactonase n=1 Tax=Corynebacterium pollutisoli TaxID=1610489 RepID=A0A1X7JS81_9CORY|nr:6-phosphogluconolactonase [Corynebacterium pollutisoli]SMG30987.1 6-phosphogluconolactonase [Corynebacterium pollutisoli]
MVTLRRPDTLSTLLDQAATSLIDVVSSLQTTGGGRHGDGVARLVLTGGGAGIGLLERIRELEDADSRIDWSRVHVFFGDDRNVPVDHEDSNEGQARDALLNHVDIPEANIHGIGLDGGEMEEAARAYEQLIEELAPKGFDIHLLGMGHEGHINTLFPHTDAVRETQRLVIAVTDSPKPPAERVTLTLPAVRRAEQVWLLVSGKDKAQAAKAIVDRANFEEWPAAGAEGTADTLLYLTDDAATAL